MPYNTRVSNRLQLNADDTELIWCATPRGLSLLPVTPIRVGYEIISLSSSVRDLGVYIDADLSMRTHAAKTTASCFAALRRIRSVRRSPPPSAIKTLVVSLVLSRLRPIHTVYMLTRTCIRYTLQGQYSQ